MHTKGWTWEDASARVDELTGDAISQGYWTRFYVLPGQGCGYTIGKLKILELRQRAMEQLGEAFDLSEFHDIVLGSGPMPLAILEQRLESWLAGKSGTGF